MTDYSKMSQYAIVDKETLKIDMVTFENSLEMYSDDKYHKVLVPTYVLEQACSADVLTAKMIDGSINVDVDVSKFKTSRAMDAVREQRDQILVSTDWMIAAGSPLSEEKKNEILEYRQTLRDLTDSGKNPMDIKIPRHDMVKFPWEKGVRYPSQ